MYEVSNVFPQGSADVPWTWCRAHLTMTKRIMIRQQQLPPMLDMHYLMLK